MAFSPQDSDEPITQINVVPLVDIMLVLLIIFMLTASFISTPSVPVNLPKAYTANPTAPASQALVLNIQGELFYQNQKVKKEDLSRMLREQTVINPELRIVLSADALVTHGKVVELLDLVRQAGVTKVALGVAAP
jgi:biopolymer transport protein TolR